MCSLSVVLAMLVSAVQPDQPLAPWDSNHHPSDVRKRHVEEIGSRRHVYLIRHAGTMDGANCRSPLGVGMMDGPPIEQTWESNRAVRLENVGETDVVNPWLSNGHNHFRTVNEIVGSAVLPGMTDRDKATALWFQQIRHRYHWAGDNAELGDPVKVFNVYGHNTCGNDSICLAGLWHRAGLKVTLARVVDARMLSWGLEKIVSTDTQKVGAATQRFTIEVAQEKEVKKPGDAMIEKYLAAETDKLARKSLDGAKTLGEWKQKRPRLYQEYMDMLGLWPMPEKTPLNATKTGEVEAHGVVVEKIHFQSKPGLYVTANLYRPRDDKQKRPAIVYVCGHSFKGRDGNKSAHQDHGFWYANNGYVCIILDSLQLGEIPGVHHGTYGQPWRHIKSYEPSREAKLPEDKFENRFWWYALGYTPAGVEAWNGVCAIDYLCSRPDVDPDRIGVTGISGGGAATFWIAAADERVKVAVPVSGMSDLESYVKHKVVNGHCDCMFLYNTYQWDWTTIAALVAPRPLLFVNSDSDPIFPMDGNRRVIAKLRTLYTVYGQASLVDEYVSSGGHAYRPDLRVAVFKFLNKHLKGDTTTPVEDCAKYTPLEGRKLRVFPMESDLPKDALNGRIDEYFIPRAKVKLPEKGEFVEWKKRMIAKLREQSFRPFPERIPAAKLKEKPKSWEGWELVTEPNIVTVSVLIQQSPLDKPTRSAFVIWDEKEVAKRSANWPFDEKWVIPYLRKRDPAAFLASRGVFPSWENKSPPNYVARAHALLGRTVDQGRVWDICAEVGWYREHTKQGKVMIDNFRLVGRGQAGILAAYAALFEPSIKEVVIIDPPKSHKEGPYFLNILRVLDIPEALGLLAPTPLTIIGGKDPAFDRTAELYRLAGAEDKLQRK